MIDRDSSEAVWLIICVCSFMTKTTHSHCNTAPRLCVRICVTLTTKLRHQLGLPPLAHIANPFPVSEETAYTYLQTVLESPQVWVDTLGVLGSDQQSGQTINQTTAGA